MAPETLRREKYSSFVDIWALGILLFRMLHRHAPYNRDSIEQIERQIKEKELRVDEQLTLLMISALKRMLHKESHKRITFRELLKIEFGKKNTINCKEGNYIEIENNSQRNTSDNN